eukprot:350636-Chlamydomonas_euryale.AAC.4
MAWRRSHAVALSRSMRPFGLGAKGWSKRRLPQQHALVLFEPLPTAVLRFPATRSRCPEA